MPNNVINKVVYGDRTLIDLTDTTADAADVASGKYFYAKDGVKTLGTGSIGGENGDVYQDAEGYLVLKPGPGTNVAVTPLSVTENGTYSAPTGVAYSPVEVSVIPNIESLTITPTEEQQTFDGTNFEHLYDQTVYNYPYEGEATRNLTQSLTEGQIYKLHWERYYMDKSWYPTEIKAQGDLTFTCSSSGTEQIDSYVTIYPSTCKIKAFNNGQYDAIAYNLYFYGASNTLDGYIPVTVNAISSNYIGTGVSRNTSANVESGYIDDGGITYLGAFVSPGYYSLSVDKTMARLYTSENVTVSGRYVSIPSGYYSQAFSKAIGTGALSAPDTYYDSATDKLIARTWVATSGYLSKGTSSSYSVAITGVLPTLLTTSYTPTETAQTISSKQWIYSSLTIAAISSTYVGTGVDRRSAADLTVNGSYVNGSAGYYSEAFSKAVSTGSITFNNSLVSYDLIPQNISLFSSTGLLTISGQAATQRRPSTFSAGYFSSIPSYWVGANISGSYSLPVFAATTWTPSSTNQYISSYQWLTGSQAILGDANLVASNIKSGVSIFGVNGTVPDENDLPTIYATWDENIGAYGSFVYSCNYTYSQITSMLTALDGNPLVGEYHDIWDNDGTIMTVRNGGNWIIDYNIHDPVLKTLNGTVEFRYLSDGSFEQINLVQYKNVTPSRDTQYVYPDYPYEYLYQVVVSGDNNLVSSNIRSGVSIFGVEGTLSGDRSFENNIVQRKYISSYINNDISMIGPYAFASQTIGYMECLSVKSIYSYAFQYAGYSTFSNGMSFPSCTSLGEGTFYGAGISKVSFPSCIVIPGSCFYSCSNLIEVSFPNCTRISHYAFYYATKLISADFPHVASIDQSAFYNCSKLTSISFPECTYVGGNVFAHCGSLENVYLPMLSNSVYSGCIGVFLRCSILSSIYLPAMTHIGKSMFYSCAKLKNVSIPLCESIFENAFYNCTSLSSISFSLCTCINDSAFKSCTNLIDVSLPVLISLRTAVFESCTALESINLPSVESLTMDTFLNCNNLKKVSLPVCSYFGTRVFGGCSSLAFNNIYAPNVTKIGGSVFADCIGFSEVFYSSVVLDGTYAFARCQNLTSVTFVDCPGIWTFTFASCYNLLSLYLLGSSVTALSNRSAFYSTPMYGYTTSTGGISGSIFVPASLYDSYISATNWTYLSSRFVSLTDAEIETLLSTLT